MLNLTDKIAYVEKFRELIYEAESFLWKNPETGYREWKSNTYLSSEFEKLGYTLTMAGNIPGFFTEINTGRPGPCVLVMSELDSLICPEHPDADPKTGAVHACGHHAQGAALLGLAAALKNEGALDGLSGIIKLCVVPAEELIETGYRETLRKKGDIKYFGGKVEFMYRGYFDDVDIAFMVHTGGGTHCLHVGKGGNGCIVKNITFEGVASHAGGSPHSGINALYAANIGIQAINALRETFRDNDHIRVHPIITKGGTAVNAIPSEVTMESYVRGADIKVIKEVNYKVNRALAGAALSLGANVFLSDRPGYTPLINDKNLCDIAGKAMKNIVQNSSVNDDWDTGCTDMGDISAVIPAIHAYCGGASGKGHGMDYKITDIESACMESTKFQLCLLHMLLCDDAASAKIIIANKSLRYSSIKEYLDEIDSFVMDKRAVLYNENSNIEIEIK